MPSKKQPKSPTNILRQNLKKSGFSYKEIADATGIGYHRLRRIVLYDVDPTFDEAVELQEALSRLARQAIERFTSVSVAPLR